MTDDCVKERLLDPISNIDEIFDRIDDKGLDTNFKFDWHRRVESSNEGSRVPDMLNGVDSVEVLPSKLTGVDDLDEVSIKHVIHAILSVEKDH